MGKIKKVAIHAGHNPSGKVACGATGILDESKENRIITRKVIRKLRLHGIKAKNCTVNNGTSQNDVLSKICKKTNAINDVDLVISIHFNSGAGDKSGNGKTTGTEVLVTANKGVKGSVASRICTKMKSIGFTNRGVKEVNNLYVLNHTTAPALLVEVCFVDDKDDAKLYKNNKDAIANAIVTAILQYNKSLS